MRPTWPGQSWRLKGRNPRWCLQWKHRSTWALAGSGEYRVKAKVDYALKLHSELKIMEFLREAFSLPGGNPCHLHPNWKGMEEGHSTQANSAAYLDLCRTFLQHMDLGGHGFVRSGRSSASQCYRGVKVRTLHLIRLQKETQRRPCVFRQTDGQTDRRDTTMAWQLSSYMMLSHPPQLATGSWEVPGSL